MAEVRRRSLLPSGKAVRAWVDADFRGTLEMATGSGKTLTSMVCSYRLWEKHRPLLIVVAAPYVPLIEQWCSEVEHFGLKPHNLTTANGAAGRARKLQELRRALQLGVSSVEAVIVSHDTLCTDEFAKVVSTFPGTKLLIADEAHNLGRAQFLHNPPDYFDFRLALSATPVRQYDPEGTSAIFDFFGPVVFAFTLREAIGTCLVEYDYHVHTVDLTHDEMAEWGDLTHEIRQNAWRQENGKPDDKLAKLYRDRRALLELAENKLPLLESLLMQEDIRSLKHTLIYTTDKDPDQLDKVNAILKRNGVLFHQLTARETSSRDATARIIKAFQKGDIQVLTAKRVLDEGVNIPQIRKAYVLASTTVERQWVQRRGRLLRICPDIGKAHSVIHDFLPLPPEMDQGLDADAKSLIKSELRRIQEFASLVRRQLSFPAVC
ncbi:MAG: DEAD/DEAH box helicase family protein [Planctomycetota bacterium]|nr:DEAD/DEAH box helicase family protein [Planctomycetota bacterium]